MMSDENLDDMLSINEYINSNILEDNEVKFDKQGLMEISLALNIAMPRTIALLKILGKSITIFTGAHVETVRDPSQYDKDKSDTFTPIANSRYSDFAASFPEDFISAEDYEVANALLMKLANTSDTHQGKPKLDILYRGVTNISFNLLNAWIRPGNTFDLGTLASASIIESATSGFRQTNPYNILLVIHNKQNKGLYVSGLSAFPDEEEVIIAGEVTTTGCLGTMVKGTTNMGKLIEQKTTNWEDILNSKAYATALVKHNPAGDNVDSYRKYSRETIKIYVDLI